MTDSEERKIIERIQEMSKKLKEYNISFELDSKDSEETSIIVYKNNKIEKVITGSLEEAFEEFYKLISDL